MADVLVAFDRRQAASGGEAVAALTREVFNGVALSPYTTFADRLTDVVLALAEPMRLGAEAAVDVLSYMLRHLCRHLTAFDLSVFHNFGANYPDALFLDALLRAYDRLLAARPDLFLAGHNDPQTVANQKRLRRRALRQACLVRQSYEGHRVPDAPTSMGENLRVLPPPFARVPEEQIAELANRRRKLYDGQPLDVLLSKTAAGVLQAGVADLHDPRELAELGTAGFLDRPLGVLKQPGEVDRTPLVACEAFSRSTAKQRLARLKSFGWIAKDDRDSLTAAVAMLPAGGLLAADLALVDRPGVVSLADMLKVAPDFALLRSTRSSLDELLAAYDWRPLESVSPATAAWLASSRAILLVHNAPPGTPPTLRFIDAAGAPRLAIGFDRGAAGMVQYIERGGRELPARLQLLAVAHEDDNGQSKLEAIAGPAIWIELNADGTAF